MPAPSLTLRAALAAALLLLALPSRAQTTPAPHHEFGIPSLPAHSLLGWAVAGMSDLDEDGLEEIAIGLPGVNTASGGVLVVSGTFNDGAELVSPNPQSSGQFGYALSRIRRPGLANAIVLAVGAPGESVNGQSAAGRTYLLAQDLSPTPVASPNVEPGGLFGHAVAGAGDPQDTGLAGLLVGAPGESPGNVSEAGRAYLYTFVGNPVALEPANPVPDGHFGWAVGGLGDVDDDGADEVLVGAPSEDVPGFPKAGRVYGFYGDGSPLGAVVSPDPEADGGFGFAVAGARDVNGDGVPDFLVGAPGEDGGRGRAYLFDGASADLLATLTSPSAQSQNFGWAVTLVPDLDDDGRDDVLVGARADADDQPGRAYVFSGATQALIARLESPNEEAEGGFGWSVGVVGDITGDGRADLLVGAPAEDPGNEASNTGRAYVYGSGAVTPIEPGSPAAGAVALGAAFPNPLGARATVPFTLEAAAHVRLAVYDALGREVAVLVDGERPAGAHAAELDGARLAPGVYVARLTAGDVVQTRRLTVAR